MWYTVVCILIHTFIDQYYSYTYGVVPIFTTDTSKPLALNNKNSDVTVIRSRSDLREAIKHINFDQYDNIVVIQCYSLSLRDTQYSSEKYTFIQNIDGRASKLLLSNASNVDFDYFLSALNFNPDNMYEATITNKNENFDKIYESTMKLKLIKTGDDFDQIATKIFNHYLNNNKKTIFLIIPKLFDIIHGSKYYTITYRNKIPKLVSKTHSYTIMNIGNRDMYDVDKNGIVNTGTLTSYGGCFMFFYSKFTLILPNDDKKSICPLSSVPVTLNGSQCGSLIKMKFDDDDTYCTAKNITLEMSLITHPTQWKCNKIKLTFKYNDESVILTSNCSSIIAPYTFSYTCNRYHIISEFNSKKFVAILNYFQIQNSPIIARKFNPSVDCNPTFTVATWNGIFVSILVAMVIAWGLCTLCGFKSFTTFPQPNDVIELGKNS